MSRSESAGRFRYDGNLVFNGLYYTNVIDPEFDLENIVDSELSDFNVGTPGVKSAGYRMLDFVEHISRNPEISDRIKQSVDDFRAIRYEYEEWETKEVHDNGKLVEKDVRETDSFDIYWKFPDYIFVKGNKSESKKAEQLLEYKLSDYIKVEQVGFSPDFLLWMFSQVKSGQSFGKGLSASMLTDCEIEGEERDRYGKRNKVDNSTDVTKSTTALMGILRNKNITELEGVFAMDRSYLTVSISAGGRVHVKAEQAIQGSDHGERMALSLNFMNRLMSLYDSWVELPPEDRYPPDEFFEDIYNECEKQGAEVTFSVKDVMKEYRSKGNKDEYSDRQAGLDEW